MGAFQFGDEFVSDAVNRLNHYSVTFQHLCCAAALTRILAHGLTRMNTDLLFFNPYPCLSACIREPYQLRLVALQCYPTRFALSARILAHGLTRMNTDFVALTLVRVTDEYPSPSRKIEIRRLRDPFQSLSVTIQAGRDQHPE